VFGIVQLSGKGDCRGRIAYLGLKLANTQLPGDNWQKQLIEIPKKTSFFLNLKSFNLCKSR
jgi:hypothetical protein